MNQHAYPPLPALGTQVGDVYRSLCEQLEDAVAQAGFCEVVLGLSGGIDSALTAVLAVDTFGAARVHGVIMPAPHSTPGSVCDAQELADNLGIKTHTVAIDAILTEYDRTLHVSMPTDGDTSRMRQNVQARIRANILMAFSNQFAWLVLCTSNRSESLVGYTTLYGDMVGAFAPLAPLYKGWVYELARFCNAGRNAIPDAILQKAPSAELEPGQTDEAELGSYMVLDAVLYRIDRGMTKDQLLEAGFKAAAVADIAKRITQARFKQRFAPRGATLSPHRPE